MKNDAAAAFLGSALDHVALGAVIAGAKGLVLFANRAAARILAANDGLFVRNGMLACSSGEVAGRLLAALDRAVDQETPPRGGLDVLSIERKRCDRPLNVWVTPLAGSGSDDVTAGVFISDPGFSVTPDPWLLGLYRLTPAEETLALALLRGDSVTVAARQMGISLNTARTHLKRVFHKTSTRRQGELISLLATGLSTF